MMRQEMAIYNRILSHSRVADLKKLIHTYYE